MIRTIFEWISLPFRSLYQFLIETGLSHPLSFNLTVALLIATGLSLLLVPANVLRKIDNHLGAYRILKYVLALLTLGTAIFLGWVLVEIAREMFGN